MRLALSSLVSLGRKTVTGMISASGAQFSDWSSDYRLFLNRRFDAGAMFDVIRHNVVERLDKSAPLVVALDDTLLRRSGKKVHGAGWRRDPLGPKFQTNLVWAQRALQASAAVPYSGFTGSARMIPVWFSHAPTPPKPSRKADEAQMASYRLKVKASNMSLRGAEAMRKIKGGLDADGSGRRLWFVTDGGFTNGTVFRNKPHDATLIGRIRKDAKLYHLPTGLVTGRGRKRSYGERAPTPEQLRVDESVAWESVTVFAGGEARQMRVKTIAPVRWRSAGGEKDLRLVVIAPAGYRLRKGGKLLYGQPSYLICDDMEIPVEKLVQAYVWRWGIEMNFRDEKQIIGVGEAHVRKENSVESLPQFLVATYAMAQLAAMKAYGDGSCADSLPLPRWRKDKPVERQTMSGIISRLRVELWGKALGGGKFSGFARDRETEAKGEKFVPDLVSSVFYAMA